MSSNKENFQNSEEETEGHWQKLISKTHKFYNESNAKLTQNATFMRINGKTLLPRLKDI